jgi:hypothetical protein
MSLSVHHFITKIWLSGSVCSSVNTPKLFYAFSWNFTLYSCDMICRYISVLVKIGTSNGHCKNKCVFVRISSITRKKITGRIIHRPDALEKDETCHLHSTHVLRNQYLFRNKTLLTKEIELTRILMLCQCFLINWFPSMPQNRLFL